MTATGRSTQFWRRNQSQTEWTVREGNGPDDQWQEVTLAEDSLRSWGLSPTVSVDHNVGGYSLRFGQDCVAVRRR